MLNTNKPSPMLDAPIPGQGMTAPLGGRPWQQPPKYTTPEQALSFYINRISEGKQLDKLLDLVELGVPVDTLVDSLQLGGVMEGLHSVDTGILIAPALMETINQVGLKAGLKPVMPTEEEDPEKSSDAEIALQLKKIEDKEGSSVSVLDDVEESLEEPVVEEQEIPTGLMARRV
jgi:hypothetical protein